MYWLETRLAGSLNSVFRNGSLGTLFCLCRFLVIRCRNCTPFIFFWFPYSVRNVLKNFQNCSQQDRPVGELDQPVFLVL